MSFSLLAVYKSLYMVLILWYGWGGGYNDDNLLLVSLSKKFQANFVPNK
jgi:hypothetical protein